MPIQVHGLRVVKLTDTQFEVLSYLLNQSEQNEELMNEDLEQAEGLLEANTMSLRLKAFKELQIMFE